MIRLKQCDLEAFVDQSRIEPGTLEQLYPEARRDVSVGDGGASYGSGGRVAPVMQPDRA